MKNALRILACLLLPAQVWAATYYVDGSAGNDGNAGTSFGAAYLTIGKAASVVAAGDTVNVCASVTYTLTSTVTWNVAGTTGAGRVTVQGANATGTVDGTQAIITSATNSVALFTLVGANFNTFKNLKFTHTAGTRGIGITCNTSNSGNIKVDSCTFDGCLNALGNGGASITAPTLQNVEIKNCTSSGISGPSITAEGCFIHDNSQHGVTNSFGSNVFQKSVFANNGSCGFSESTSSGSALGTFVMRDCVFANNTADGIKCTGDVSTTNGFDVSGNIFYGNGGYGQNWSNLSSAEASALSAIIRNNFYGGNTTADRNNFPAGTGDVTGLSNPFTSTSGSNRNYSLNNTAGAGALVRAASFPGTFPGASFAAYPDGGAVQHQDSGGGGSGGAMISTLSGGMSP